MWSPASWRSMTSTWMWRRCAASPLLMISLTRTAVKPTRSAARNSRLRNFCLHAPPKTAHTRPTLGYCLVDEAWRELEANEVLLKTVSGAPAAAMRIHAISTERLQLEGVEPAAGLARFGELVARASLIVAHNAEFDAELLGRDFVWPAGTEIFCTMQQSTPRCRLTPHVRGKFKWPKLTELADALGIEYDAKTLHSALADARLAARAFAAATERGWWNPVGASGSPVR